MSFRPTLRTAANSLKSARPATQLTRLALTRTQPARLPAVSSFLARRSYATSMTDTSSSFDPQAKQAQDHLDAGTRALEQGDLEAAAVEYKASLKVKDSAIGHYNLGVVQYQQQQLPAAIASFEASLALTPKPKGSQDPNEPIPVMTPERVVLGDTYTNLGAAYILSTPPRADKALENMQRALEINPDDGEVCYNLAAILEATGEIEEALIAFQRAEKLGIERAKTNIRNVGAKLLAKRREEEANPPAAKEEPKA